MLNLNAEHFTQFTETVADFVSGSILGTIFAMAFRYWAYRKWVFPELIAEAEPGDPAVEEEDFSFNVPPHHHRVPE
jgi:hypothetical protein